MAKIAGGAKVGEGYYWNARKLEIEVVPKGGGQLTGGPDAAYVKVPLLVALPVAAIVGATFLMALPAIGVVVFVQGMAKAVMGKGGLPAAGAGH